MVPEEGDTQSDMATSQVKAVELYRLCNYERASDWRMSSDITVKRGAECNTDHQFLHASLRMAWMGLKKRAGMNEGKRYEVSGLVSCKDSDDMSTGRVH